MEKNRNIVYMSNGNVFYKDSQYVDWHGNPVDKTPDEYRYSYDAYVQVKKADEYQQVVYSDRLFQWDCGKYNRLCEKHFGNHGQYWSDRDFDKIQDFLRDYYDNQELELVGQMEGCNVATGYPYWVFMFNCKFENNEN
jgi:hypothetical protein